MNEGYGTNFQESEALLALTVEDEEYAREVLSQMLPGELAELKQAAEQLARMCETEYVSRR